VQRATQWLARLQASRGPAVDGRQRLAYAEVAFLAEQDTLVRRLLDARLAESRSKATEQSLTLAAAVTLLTDLDQSPERLARNVAVATAYAKQLDALPSGGYSTQHDSAEIWWQKYATHVTLFQGAAELRQSAVLAEQLPLFLAAMQRVPHRVRWDAIRNHFPYYTVATTLAQTAEGRARLDTLDARLLQLAVPSEAERERYQAIVRDNVMAAYRFLGHAAPPLQANAWLNTPDSQYTVTPRTYRMDDGVVRVIAFNASQAADVWPALNRVHDQLVRGGASDAQVVLGTQTTGHVGPDLVGPADEVTWLRSFYATQRLRFSIAVWAGTKAIVNEYQWSQPTSSPVPDAYHTGPLGGGCCVIVDGKGIVRAILPAETREDEDRLVRTVQAIRAAVSSSLTGRP